MKSTDLEKLKELLVDLNREEDLSERERKSIKIVYDVVVDKLHRQFEREASESTVALKVDEEDGSGSLRG